MKYRDIILMAIYCALTLVMAVQAISDLHKSTFSQIGSVAVFIIFLVLLIKNIRRTYFMNK